MFVKLQPWIQGY